MSLLGEEEAYGEYFPLVESGSIEEVAQSAAAFSAHELKRGDLEVLDFHGFPPESEFMQTFVGWLSVGAHVRYIRENQPHVVIEGATSGEMYLRKMMSNRRRRVVQRHQRSLMEAGAEFEVVTRWDRGEAFEDLVRLHTARWAREGQSGRFGSPRFAEFLRNVTERLMLEGKARIYFLRHGCERICGLLVFDVHRRNYQYLIGRDPVHALVRFSIGEVLTLRSIMDTFDEGSRSCDMMGGDYRHKQYTGMTKRWYARVTAIAAGLQGAKGRMYLGGLAIRDGLARVKRMQRRRESDERPEPKSI